MLYGRRKGRSMNEHKQGLLETLLPTLDLQTNPHHPSLATFKKRWLEIGFGYGQHLIAQAQWNPDGPVSKASIYDSETKAFS